MLKKGFRDNKNYDKSEIEQVLEEIQKKIYFSYFKYGIFRD